MLSRILTAGTLAGTTLLSPLASPAGAAEGAGKVAPPKADTEHCIADAAGAAATAVEVAATTCFPTLNQARAEIEARGEFTIAIHWKKAQGSGEYYYRTGTSCASTWRPAGTWPSTLSSTQVSTACTGAKHYTNSDCSGSYQIVAPESPVDLTSPLNNNVGCVKYS